MFRCKISCRFLTLITSTTFSFEYHPYLENVLSKLQLFILGLAV